MNEPSNTERTSLRELATLFLRLGATAFGGPAAHVAMMEDEVVRRRKWLTEERFLDLMSAANLIPGPNSTELAIHIGWERRRFAGLVVAGVSFIVPAMLITGGFGWAYVRFGKLPAAGWLLYGVKPVILGVVVQAILGLVPKAAKTTRLRVLGALAVVLAALSVSEMAVLFGAGFVSVALARFLGADMAAKPAPKADERPTAERVGEGSGYETKDTKGADDAPAVAIAGSATLAATTAATTAVTLPNLFWIFLKIGSVLFGSGYVLLAFLRADLVERLHWLTEGQLIDAVAVGQVTPGPVFTTATFVGYVLAGPEGALVATLGIFLPAFVLVALSGPLVPRLRASKAASAFLDGVNVASLALMIVVTGQLGRAALVDVPTVVLAAVASLLLVRFKASSTWLVVGGAVLGFALHATGLAKV